jgi:hypothetical protein
MPKISYTIDEPNSEIGWHQEVVGGFLHILTILHSLDVFGHGGIGALASARGVRL